MPDHPFPATPINGHATPVADSLEAGAEGPWFGLPPVGFHLEETDGTGFFDIDGRELTEAEADEWCDRLSGQPPRSPLPGDSDEVLEFLRLCHEMADVYTVRREPGESNRDAATRGALEALRFWSWVDDLGPERAAQVRRLVAQERRRIEAPLMAAADERWARERADVRERARDPDERALRALRQSVARSAMRAHLGPQCRVEQNGRREDDGVLLFGADQSPLIHRGDPRRSPQREGGEEIGRLRRDQSPPPGGTVRALGSTMAVGICLLVAVFIGALTWHFSSSKPSHPTGSVQQAERIDIPEEFRGRALSSSGPPLDTSEVVAYYRARGLAEPEARQAARALIHQLVAEGAELVPVGGNQLGARPAAP